MHPRTSVWIEGDEGGRVFGPGPAELLARVREEGSLRAAAADMGMAYTKATAILRRAELGLGVPLTERTVGGAGGGGSRLTPEGERLLARYEAWRQASETSARELYDACLAGVAGVPRLGCVVMASGEARRFGRQKLIEPLVGRPVLERTLAAIPRDVYDVVVVTRSDEVASLAHDLGVDVRMHGGALQSDTLREGLDEMGDRAGCLFVPGDQPLVSEGSLRAMGEEYSRHPGSVVRLAWRGVTRSPILFPRDLFPSLRAMTGDTGGSQLLRDRPELAARTRLVEASDERELMDIDTVDDLRLVEQAVDDEG